jgi:hypothetical protein
MGRLGFMKASPVVSRRRKVQRWVTRAGLTCAASVALAIAWQGYVNGPDVRRPDGLTIPAAIGHDLQHQQHRIGSMIQTIRNLSPRPAQPDLESAPPESEPLPDQPIDEDVNRSSIAPMRWV